MKKERWKKETKSFKRFDPNSQLTWASISIGVGVGIGISVPIAVGIGVSNGNGILVIRTIGIFVIRTLKEKLSYNTLYKVINPSIFRWGGIIDHYRRGSGSIWKFDNHPYSFKLNWSFWKHHSIVQNFFPLGAYCMGKFKNCLPVYRYKTSALLERKNTFGKDTFWKYTFRKYTFRKYTFWKYIFRKYTFWKYTLKRKHGKYPFVEYTFRK